MQHYQSDETLQQLEGYAVLHARVETVMMTHKCGSQMEMNLTKILDMVDAFVDHYNRQVEIDAAFAQKNNNQTRKLLSSNNHRHRVLQGTMIAVGRAGMQKLRPKFADLATHNLKVLDERSLPYNKTVDSTKRQQQQQYSIPLFECGDDWVQQAFYSQQPQTPDNYYGDILPSILNFWLAVQADIFVGVKKSSWSTDVWTSRYYLYGAGKAGNYEYTKDGLIRAIGNGGLPAPHKNC